MGMEYDRYRLTYDLRNDRRSKLNITKRLERHPLYYWLQSLIEPHLGVPHVFSMPNGQELLLDRAKVKFALTEYHGDEPEVRLLIESVDKLRALAQENGATVAVLLIPSKEELFAAKQNIEHGAASTVAARLREMQVPVLDLAPVLGARTQEQAPYFARDIHLNEFGSRIVAEAVADWITKLPIGLQ
jgi:hypothetical protein